MNRTEHLDNLALAVFCGVIGAALTLVVILLACGVTV